MRLIHTTFIAFCEFEGDHVPDYAIVSHRWASNEVSFQIFLDTAVKDRVGTGWTKIIQGCRMARARRIRWLWIDTCCIDKRSSAELTESVNAMFRYYQQARQCFVFLPDVHACPADTAELKAQVSKSVWFTRGWTLQELLASTIATFYNSDFKLIGLKARDSSFCRTVSLITGVSLAYLHDPSVIGSASVAERMRWASLRRTTRVEDIAYCLLGLFGVNMPLLYGEETKAFMRLQIEILRKTEDESIFAWHTATRGWKGLLAPSPASFAGTRVVEVREIHKRTPSSMTNKGLQLSLALQWVPRERTTILLPLNCVALPDDGNTAEVIDYQIAIRIQVTSTLDAHNSGLRVLEGEVLSGSSHERKLIFRHISNRMCTFGYTKAGRTTTKMRYDANWINHASGNWSAYGCANVVGIFPRASAGNGMTLPVYFKQDGI
ncbi:hypothetical protein CKM354_000728200 [Cercospora kikuchii]|uniref:Heterokaryon incompatibility domain-containing protein n=1 Tax=Cercospora kikuchii TaxID=84275 RepID=A0A9P3FE67_9PEZI|nr:uncharacterized protein CKM354_000728200 [Cercospora kikuchii]GIZ44073.1 hypothetical protein CKM354_000728200 [Cercospora kikuchii]